MRSNFQEFCCNFKGNIDKISLRAQDLDKADLKFLKPRIINFFKLCLVKPSYNEKIFEGIDFKRPQIKILSHKVLLKSNPAY